MEFYVDPAHTSVSMEDEAIFAQNGIGQASSAPSGQCRRDVSRVVLLALVVVAVIVILYLVVMNKVFSREGMAHKRAPGVSEQLAAAGWKLYTKPGCVYCKMQLDALGGAYAPRVDCEEGCPDVQAFPTWVNEKTGQRLEGYQDSERLQKML